MKETKVKVIGIFICMLFFGVSISTAISIDTYSIKFDGENDCECKEVDDKHIQFLKNQLNRLEFNSKWLLVLSKHNPELKEISEELSEFSNIYGFWDDFCDAISNLAQSIQDLINNYGGIFNLLAPLFATLISIWMIFCWLY